MKLEVSSPVRKKLFLNAGEISAHHWNIPDGGRFYSLLEYELTNLSTFCFAPDECASDDKGADPVNANADVDEVLPTTTQTRTMTVSDIGSITLTAQTQHTDAFNTFADNWSVTEDASYFGVPVELVMDSSAYAVVPLETIEHVTTVTVSDARFGFASTDDSTLDNHRSFVGCTTVMDAAASLPVEPIAAEVSQDSSHNLTPEEAGALVVNFNAGDAETPANEMLQEDVDLPSEDYTIINAAQLPADEPREEAPTDTDIGTITWGNGAVTGAATSDASATLAPMSTRVSAGTFNLAMTITPNDMPADHITDSAASAQTIRFGACNETSSTEALSGGSRDDVLVSGESSGSATFNTMFPISAAWSHL